MHEVGYLRKLAETGLSEAEQFRLGLPWTPALFERCRYETGGTCATVEAALQTGIACNLAGGTHHAFPERGTGFCVLNDVAVAIRRVRAAGSARRCLVIDTDAHQGNGTNAIFCDDPDVFTYSIHVEKNYPTLKEPGDCDVGLPRWVEGEEYLRRLGETLSGAVDGFEPEFLIWIAGADVHHDDRFGQMRLSMADVRARDALVLGLHRRFEVPLAILYGGGYSKQGGLTAYLHAQTVLAAAECA